MKVLDVDSLLEGNEQISAALKEKTTTLQAIEKAMTGIIGLDRSYSGQGADSIKGFYRDCHLPFLSQLNAALELYQQKLSDCTASVQMLDSKPSALIRESYLQTEVYNGLDRMKSTVSTLTEEANTHINSVRDIVALEKIDDSETLNGVKQAHLSKDDTLSKFSSFDSQQYTAIADLKTTLLFLNQYVIELDARLSLGRISITGYGTEQLSGFMTNRILQASSLGTQMLLNPSLNEKIMRDSLAYSVFSVDYGARYALESNRWLQNNPAALPKQISGKNKDEESRYLAGSTEEKGDITLQAGAGRIENEWKIDSSQIGGGSSFTGIHTGVKHDTNLLDSSFDQDILKVEGKAGIGGDSMLGASASITGYNAKVRTELDDGVPFLPKGVEAQATAGSAKLYAGIDGASVGAGAKTALAEGEVSTIIDIPLTSYDMKLTGGGSLVGVGGEVSVGMETSIDLRFLLGVKLGISFEKDE